MNGAERDLVWMASCRHCQPVRVMFRPELASGSARLAAVSLGPGLDPFQVTALLLPPHSSTSVLLLLRTYLPSSFG